MLYPSATISKSLSIASRAKILPLDAGNRGIQKSPREVIALATKKKIEMVRLEDIQFIQADGNYTRIFVNGRLPVYIARTMKDMDRTLVRDGFIRVHQSYLVHPSCILHYDISGRVLLLRSGERIPVSRANRKKISMELLNWSAG